MAIEYDEIDTNNKLLVADILSKRESIDAALADIQTERAEFEIILRAKEQELKTEKNKLTQEIRNVRRVNVTVESIK